MERMTAFALRPSGQELMGNFATLPKQVEAILESLLKGRALDDGQEPAHEVGEMGAAHVLNVVRMLVNLLGRSLASNGVGSPRQGQRGHVLAVDEDRKTLGVAGGFGGMRAGVELRDLRELSNNRCARGWVLHVAFGAELDGQIEQEARLLRDREGGSEWPQ